MGELHCDAFNPRLRQNIDLLSGTGREIYRANAFYCFGALVPLVNALTSSTSREGSARSR